MIIMISQEGFMDLGLEDDQWTQEEMVHGGPDRKTLHVKSVASRR